MINKLDLPQLPFVDGVPDVGQTRIGWIKNGDCLTAATTKFGHDGNLNAPSVGVQANVEALEKNTIKTKDALNTVIDSVNMINEALETTANVDIIKQINTNKENIDILQVHMQFAETNIGELDTDITFVKEDVGVYNATEDPFYRTIRNNITWIKREMGAYVGQDMNGQSIVGAPSSGMKKRILDNTSELVAQRIRVKKLEDQYIESDVGEMNTRITELRDELGDKTLATNKPSVYLRLNSIESANVAQTNDIQTIKDSISFNNSTQIGARVTTLETKTQALETNINTPIIGLDARVTLIEKNIGKDAEPTTINGKLYIHGLNILEMQTIVGTTSSEGIRGEMAWLNQQIGNAVSPEPWTINFRLNALEVLTSETAATTQNLQMEIGTNQTGMKASVLKLTRQMEGTNPTGVTVAERGVIPAVTALETKAKTTVYEAPNDGHAYVRRNGAWVLLSDFLTP